MSLDAFNLPPYPSIVASVGDTDYLPAHHSGPALERLRRAVHDALNACGRGTRWRVCGLRSGDAVDLLAWSDGQRFAYTIPFLSGALRIAPPVLSGLLELARRAGPWSSHTGVSLACVLTGRGGPAIVGALYGLGLVRDAVSPGDCVRAGFTQAGAELAALLGVPVPALAVSIGCAGEPLADDRVNIMGTLRDIQNVGNRPASHEARRFVEMQTGEHGEDYADTPAPAPDAVPDLRAVLSEHAAQGTRGMTLDDFWSRPIVRAVYAPPATPDAPPVRTLGRAVLDALAALGERLRGASVSRS